MTYTFTEDEIKIFLNWAMYAEGEKVNGLDPEETVLVKKLNKIIKPKSPHKLLDEYQEMKECPYRGDYHYCHSCKYYNICKFSPWKNNMALQKHIQENIGK